MKTAEKVTHTPGPWQIVKPTYIEHGQFETTFDVMGQLRRIARCAHPMSAEVAKADARLIATAPEMGEVLREVMHDSALSAAQIRRIQDVLVKAGLIQ